MSENADRIQIHGKNFVKYIASSVLEEAIAHISRQIENDYKEDIPLLLVVMDGALVFASDLMREIQIPLEICAVKYASYQGMQSTENVKPLLEVHRNIENRRIIIVEDIVDSGLTVAAIYRMLEAENVKDVRIAALTFKPDAYRQNIPVDYVGMKIENKFIVGYGMDYDGLGRNLKDIYILQD